MNLTDRARPLGGLAMAVTCFSIALIAAGLLHIGLIGYALFAPPEIPEIVVTASEANGPGSYGDAEWADDEVAAPTTDDPYYSDAAEPEQSPPKTPPTYAEQLWEQANQPAGWALIAMVLALIGFTISALTWVWRAHSNMASRGIAMKYSPGMTAMSYLIPGMNLIVPFEAMRELHNRSHGEIEEFSHSPVDNVTAWWAATIVGLLVFSGLLVKYGINYLTYFVFITPLWMEFILVAFALILLLGSTLLFAGLIRAITAVQPEHLATIDPIEASTTAPQRPMVRLIEHPEGSHRNAGKLLNGLYTVARGAPHIEITPAGSRGATLSVHRFQQPPFNRGDHAGQFMPAL